uniref:Uncharacterized protein n=1 Tax=viral metagenome TaxID=1070528 RepID=A0A6M3JAB0_9ZZZZ
MGRRLIYRIEERMINHSKPMPERGRKIAATDAQLRRYLQSISRIHDVSIEIDTLPEGETCGWHGCELPAELIWRMIRYIEQKPVRGFRKVCRFHATWVAAKYEIEIPGGNCGGMARD